MFQLFYPDAYVDSVRSINFEKLREEGIEGVLFDIDNTLVPHGAGATEEVIRLFIRLSKLGLRTCLVSNNKKERVEMFNTIIGSPFIYKAGKPKKSGYMKAMKKLGTDAATTVFVGDQLFTDIWGAKRTGIRTILVRPIDPKEEIQIVLKRYLEKIILAQYKKKVEKGRNLL